MIVSGKKKLLILALILAVAADAALMWWALRENVPAWKVSVIVPQITVLAPQPLSPDEVMEIIEKKPENLSLRTEQECLCQSSDGEEGFNYIPPYSEFEESPTPQPPPVVVPEIGPVTGNPKIAIVLDDMGVVSPTTERAIRLPASVTLSFLPYIRGVSEQVARAKDAGHMIMLHMPMEPVGGENPGPEAMLTGLSDEEIERRALKALGSFGGYEGANNHMGSKFTSSLRGMKIISRLLAERGLFFLDSRTSSKSVAEQAAHEQGAVFIGRDVFLDDEVDIETIRRQLWLTGQTARRKGFAVAIGHPHGTTLQALEEWIPEAEKKGFVLVPLRDLLDNKP
jgi:polysaccharide deacetylase 2 family uncharacterized protein YibQ